MITNHASREDSRTYEKNEESEKTPKNLKNTKFCEVYLYVIRKDVRPF
jgi:hypothetical protein